MRSRSISKKSKMKRSPKTKQKSLKRMMTVRSSFKRRKSRRSIKKRNSPITELRSRKRRSVRVIVRSSKRKKSIEDSGKKIKSRRKKEVHYQKPLVPNYKIIRNRNTSYYEKQKEDEQNYYDQLQFSYSQNFSNNNSAGMMQKQTFDDKKNPPESALKVVALDDDDNVKQVKPDNDNRRVVLGRNKGSKKMFTNKFKNKQKLFLNDDEYKEIKKKIGRDYYKKGKFKTYDKLPLNVRERISEKKYHNIIKKVEKKYSVPGSEDDENVIKENSEHVEEITEEITEEPSLPPSDVIINTEQKAIGNEEIATPTQESSTSPETI